jgi:ribose transport system substrate-binding protein
VYANPLFFLSLGMFIALLGPAWAQEPPADLPQGIVRPVNLPPYDVLAGMCAAPQNLVRSLVFVQDNTREFMQGVRRGLELAANDRHLPFSVALADNDTSRMLRQLNSIVDAKSAAVVVAPVNAAAAKSVLQRLIHSGTYVGTVVPPPAITLLNAPQYLTGKVLGDAAAKYISERLGGKANVVLLTHDSLQFLSPRFAAMRDALRNLPGVEIVADISPLTVDEKGGYATMQTILLANKDIDVVLGADTVVLGALAALRAADKARPQQFLGGIDGEPKAVAEIKRGGPYKASVSLASPIFGYALGQFAADWLEGLTVPQAMDILPYLLTEQNIPRYEADVANPGAVYGDLARRAIYLQMYGNICFDTRFSYINFPWSSERNNAR